MNKKVLTAATIAALSCFVSNVWAERPDIEKPVCTFPGGAYYLSNNTLYLESLNDASSYVEIKAEDVACVNGYADNGNFDLIVERNTALTANSTITLPLSYSPKDKDCISLYQSTSFTEDAEGNWVVSAHNTMGSGNAHTPLLMIVNTNDEKCTDIKEIAFSASNLQQTNQEQAYYWLYNQQDGQSDWILQGTYSYVSWDKDNADLGKIYGYTAKAKGKYGAGQFAKAAAGAFIPPLRAYLRYQGTRALSKSADSGIELPKEISVKLIDDNKGTTHIARWNTVTGEIKKMNGVYDLKGRKLNSKPQNKGMFIGNTNIQK